MRSILIVASKLRAHAIHTSSKLRERIRAVVERARNKFLDQIWMKRLAVEADVILAAGIRKYVAQMQNLFQKQLETGGSCTS